MRVFSNNKKQIIPMDDLIILSVFFFNFLFFIIYSKVKIILRKIEIQEDRENSNLCIVNLIQ